MRAAGIVVLVALLSLPAIADEATGKWFKSLMQPDNPNGSCCDISDCHPTASEWRDGAWWAIVAGEWRVIPPNKILNKVSILEDAVVCHSNPVAGYLGSDHTSVPTGEPTIYCFVPPPLSF